MSLALLSVYNKEGLLELAEKMVSLGVGIISTGGTAKYLRDAGVLVKEVSDYTGFPEMMDGRVKTLHPKVHGGILARRSEKNHLRDLSENKIDLIDYVVVNLYPFQEVVSKEGTSLEEAIENIDIGGPSMIRSGAKNHENVTVITSPSDYAELLEELEKQGKTTPQFRKKMAVKAFRHTFAYDYNIQKYFSARYEVSGDDICLFYEKMDSLRYGENPHQKAELFARKDVFSLARDGKILAGKEMSFNNYVDAYFARQCLTDLESWASACVVKHGTPCGIATGGDVLEALRHAWEADIVSAFGSIVAMNREVDKSTAEFFSDKFVEVLVAPSYSQEALDILTRKKNLRLMSVDMSRKDGMTSYKQLDGMLLVQDEDKIVYDSIKVVSGKDKEEKKGLLYFTCVAVKHIKSNAIAMGYEYKKNCFMLLGMGSGQPNRIDAFKKLAIPKAKENIERIYPDVDSKKIFSEVVLASDAFFPFADVVELAFKEGIYHVVQPGGSKNDNEVIEYCNEHSMTMWFTGVRHFLH